jgi:hypothetical protein
MNQIIWTFLLTIFLEMAVLSQKVESRYTDLKSCKEIESDGEDGILYRGECQGIGGYKLHLLEGDLRQSLDLIAPNGKKHQLGLWLKVAAPMYSYVGEKAEWRIVKMGKKIKPFALIVRFNAYEDSSNPQKAKSFLVVVKINQKTACITDVIEPTVKDQNIKARKLADVSANKPCRESWRGNEN